MQQHKINSLHVITKGEGGAEYLWFFSLECNDKECSIRHWNVLNYIQTGKPHGWCNVSILLSLWELYHVRLGCMAFIDLSPRVCALGHGYGSKLFFSALCISNLKEHPQQFCGRLYMH